MTAVSGSLTEADYRAYIAAFNRGDFDGFGRYYAENVLFEGRGGTFHSREQVLKFYSVVRSRLRETIHILDLVIGASDIAADLQTELYALVDWPDFPTGPIRKGQTVRSQNFLWYDVTDRKFTHIRSAHYRTL